MKTRKISFNVRDGEIQMKQIATLWRDANTQTRLKADLNNTNLFTCAMQSQRAFCVRLLSSVCGRVLTECALRRLVRPVRTGLARAISVFVGGGDNSRANLNLFSLSIDSQCSALISQRQILTCLALSTNRSVNDLPLPFSLLSLRIIWNFSHD